MNGRILVLGSIVYLRDKPEFGKGQVIGIEAERIIKTKQVVGRKFKIRWANGEVSFKKAADLRKMPVGAKQDGKNFKVKKS